MLPLLLAFGSGLLFGAGLALSQMINPQKVLNFLDVAGIADGRWDPSLAFVMAGALVVTALGYRLVLRRPAPLASPKFQLPADRELDMRLAAGAVLFGIGWGLVGYCPGPAIAALSAGARETFVFVAAMLAGMAFYRLVSGGGWLRRRAAGLQP